ncbi:MAG: carbon-nitrogen hydrolase family protein [Acidiferrobacterales bacterium]
MDTTCRRAKAGARRSLCRTLIPIGTAALLGWTWHWGSVGPVAALGLIPTVVRADHRVWRWATAAAYFLAGSSGIPAGAATFFGPGPNALWGYGLWMLSAGLLALPWIWAQNGVGAVTALLLDALPPLGCFGWLSPLTAAGVFFPGTGLLGLGGLLALAVGLAARRHALVAIGLIFALGINIDFRYFRSAPAPPQGWIGINTRVGPLSGTILDATLGRAGWLAQIRDRSRHASVVVLPETIAGPWWPGTAAQIQATTQPRQIWLVGATVQTAHGLEDAVMQIRQPAQAPASRKPLFVSPFPVPVSMWKPWTHGGYRAGLWEPIHTVGGVRTWATICYDQLLPWVWFEGVLQQPRLVLAVSNDWWARGTGAHTVQAASVRSWTRLMGTALISATNRQPTAPERRIRPRPLQKTPKKKEPHPA